MRAPSWEVCYKLAVAVQGVVLRQSGSLGGEWRLAGERLDNRLDQSAREEAEQDGAGGSDQ